MNTLLFIGNIGTAEILVVAIFLLIMVFLLISKPSNNPTWTGIIISLLTGTIVLYLLLCYWGILGEERKREGSDQL